MKKKILTLMIIMSLAVGSVACGSDKNNTEPTATPTATVQDTNTNDNQNTENNDNTQNDVQDSENQETTDNTDNNVSAYADATAALNAVWEKFEEDYMFPCFGGSIETAVENAAGKIDPADVNTMTSTLLIPEDVQAVVKDASSLMHMMNANTFTGAAIKVEGMEIADVANKIKDSFLGTHFMCGMPDMISIGTVDGYVVYAFGAEDLVNYFAEKLGSLEGGSVIINQAFELDF